VTGSEDITTLLIFIPSMLFGIAVLGFILSDKKKKDNN
jgi:hypothetical protein